MNKKQIDKVLKKLELGIYADEEYKADFMKYLKFNDYVRIYEAFTTLDDSRLVGEVLTENRMFSIDEVVSMLETVQFNLKN